jgi:probable phosphoglycerate mutase
MGLTLFFLRHGETTASQFGEFCGILDPELTSDGRLMADDFASFYASFPWTAVFSSPLKRAVAMVQPLCNATGTQTNLRDELKEIYFGKWEGMSPEEVGREFHDDYIRWMADPGWNAPTGGEKGIEIARAGAHILGEIYSTYSEGNVLVVSHKATIRIMLCLLLGIDIGRFRDRLSLPAGSVCIVEMAAHGPLLHVMGDRSYLRDSLQGRN